MKSSIQKVCRVCGLLKPGRAFAFGMDMRAERCRACDDKAKASRPKRCPKPRPNAGSKGRATALIAGAKLRSRQKKLPFDLDRHVAAIQSRLDGGKCEMTGVPLSFTGKRSSTSPSLDRIDPCRGYVYDNVRIICWAMNAALGTWGEDDLRRIVTAWIGSESGTIAPWHDDNVLV